MRNLSKAFCMNFPKLGVNIEKISHLNWHIFLHHSLQNFDFTYLKMLHQVILLVNLSIAIICWEYFVLIGVIL